MNVRRASRSLVFTLVVAAAAPAFADDPASRTRDNTPMIPRAALFGNPERAGPQLSPDGTRIAYLASLDSVLNVWVAPTGKLDAAQAVTRDKSRGIRQYFWAYDNTHIIYLQDVGGDENWQVFATDINTQKTRELTPIKGIQARIMQVNYRYPTEILVGINDRVPQLHDVYRINILTGERKLIEKNEQGFVGYTTDEDLNVRLASRMTPEGGIEVVKKLGDQWVDFQKIGQDDSLTTGVVSFDKSGKTLYMNDSRGRDTGALTSVNVDTGAEQVIAVDPRADVSDVMMHPTENTVQAVSFTFDRTRWQILDPAVQGDIDYLKKVEDGELNVVSRTQDDKNWIAVYVMDNGPVKYYHYDRANKKAHFLFTNRPALEKLPLAKMHPIVIKTRDGLDMVCYYSLPVWADTDGDGRPTQPLPMVLDVHGGPWARDNWGYHPEHQWLANRGYAVMSVNYRGSTGFGKKFINAANHEWAGKMHDDLIDAVDWAISQKIADSAKVAIYGGSYGGFSALVGVTFTPDKFACSVDIVGPSNIATLLASIPEYWKPMQKIFHTRVGDPTTEEGRKLLKERSPLTYVERIKKPLLIAQGANDPRVKQAEADQIVRAMKERKIPVTYVLFPDEGHGFARPENRTSFYAVSEAFLSQHLGGRFEAVGNDFKGASLKVPEGADQVPGLSAALKG